MGTRIPHNSQWMVITVKEPVVFNRAKDEAWLLNPVRRYIFNAHHLTSLEGYIDTISDLKNAPHFRPLQAGAPVIGAKVLIERYRDRGIGDLLFMTGPMAFLHHITGGKIALDAYAFADRGQIYLHNPLLRYKTVLVGPAHFDDLPLYNYHWFSESVTEFDEEPDQLNVYDALFKQIGVDHTQVDPRFKRPSLTVGPDEAKGLDQFFFLCWLERKIDLRKTGYYVAAPLTHSALRIMNYSQWLALIKEVSRRRPVVVVGNLHDRLPDSDMTVGEFVTQINEMGANVLNAMDATPLRVLVALISKANCVFALDSGPLYVAQALRVPAISVWGPHDPGVRIGYDPDYMDLAVWKPEHCNYAPCFAYSGFPTQKCPRGENQRVCEVLASVTAEDVVAKLDQVETKRITKVGTFSPKQNETTAPAAA